MFPEWERDTPSSRHSYGRQLRPAGRTSGLSVFLSLVAVAALCGQRGTPLPFSSCFFFSTEAPAAPALIRFWSGGSSRELCWVTVALTYLLCNGLLIPQCPHFFFPTFLHVSPYKWLAILVISQMKAQRNVSLTVLGAPWDQGPGLLIFLQLSLLAWGHSGCAHFRRFRDWNPVHWLLLLERREKHPNSDPQKVTRAPGRTLRWLPKFLKPVYTHLLPLLVQTLIEVCSEGISQK